MDVPRPVLGGLLVAAALTFAGFETTAVHAGRVRHPRRAMHVCVTLPALPRQRIPGAHRPERVNSEELTG